MVEVLWVKESVIYGCPWIPITGIAAYNVISSLGFSAIIGMVQAEVFPLNVKAIAMTLLNVIGGCLSYGVSLAYGKIKEDMGSHCIYWLLVAVSICAALFTYFVVPETRGKSLSEIQDLLQGDKKAKEITELTNIHSNPETNTSVYLKPNHQTFM